MSNTSKTLLFLVAVFLFPACSDASVVIDDFDSAAKSSLVDDGSVIRRLAGGASEAANGDVSFAGDRLSMLVYEVDGGGTFGSLAPEISGGVTFADTSSTVGSDFEIALYADGVLADFQSFVDGTMTFGVDLSAASQIVFLSLGCGDGHSATLGGNFSAVPEPTSLILVGIACSGLVFHRRRSMEPTEA